MMLGLACIQIIWHSDGIGYLKDFFEKVFLKICRRQKIEIAPHAKCYIILFIVKNLSGTLQVMCLKK